MKNILYVFIALVFIACETPLIEKVDKKYPNGSKKVVGYYQESGGKQILVEQKHYYLNGALKMTGKLSDGKRDGEWKSYFKNKQLQSTGVFKNGLRTGIVNVYFPDGQLQYSGEYENDREHGHWKFYSKKGELIREKDY